MNASQVGFPLAAALLVVGIQSLSAEEKNGLQLSVVKKTLERADVRVGSYYYDRIDRTQGLKVTLKNISFKEMPEGEVEWTIIVRKYYSTAVEGFKGVEKLKALRPAEAIDMIMGSAQITGWRELYDAAKDKMEYQVVVKQAGAEVVRSQSTSGFDALAKRANVRKVKAADTAEAEPVKAPSTPKATPVPKSTPVPLPKATPTPTGKATPVPAQPPPDAPLNGGALK
jgi:hypothetical protein